MTLRYIVQAVRERESVVRYLQKHIPNLEVCWDRRRSAFQTWIDAMRLAGDDPCVHLEDDILLTEGFTEKVEREIAARPNALIQFFSMRKADASLGSRWDRKFAMNQCWYCPPGMGLDMVAYATTWLPKNADKNASQGAYDTMMNDYLKWRGVPHWIVVPSLVQHREMKSMIGPRSSKRQSPTFVDPIPDTDG